MVRTPANSMSRSRVGWGTAARVLQRFDSIGPKFVRRAITSIFLGIFGNSIYRGYFDVDCYQFHNDDLSGTPRALWRHFLRHGRMESRVASERFSPHRYVSLFPEWKGASRDYLLHFIVRKNYLPASIEEQLRVPPPIEEDASLSADDGPGDEVGSLKLWGSSLLERVLKFQSEVTPVSTTSTRVAFFDWSFPRPDQDSGSLRLTRILEIVVAAGFEVVFIAIGESSSPQDEAGQLDGVRWIAGLETGLVYLLGTGGIPERNFVARPDTAIHVIPLLKLLASTARAVYDCVDLHWLRLERELMYNSAVSTAEVYTVKSMEQYAFRHASTVLAISETEATYIQEVDQTASIAVLANIAPEITTAPGDAPRSGLVFLGSYLHSPNVDAAQYIVQSVAPLISQGAPGLAIEIAGYGFENFQVTDASSNVEVIGTVDDLDSYLSQKFAMIAPLRFGAGMKGKILSGMLCGLPIITTRIGAEGMGLVDEVNCLLAESPEEFAEAVTRLLNDNELWVRLSENGQRHIESICGREMAETVLRKVLDLRQEA